MNKFGLVLVPVILSTALLVGLRVLTPPQQPAKLVGSLETITRGHDLKTAATEQKDYLISNTHIKLAGNSTLTLEDSSTSIPRLALREGRIVTIGPVDITVRNTTIHATDTATFIFYSWLDKLEVHSLKGELTMSRQGVTVQAPPDFTLDTLRDDSTPEVVSPAATASSTAKDFYDWALN